MVAAVCSGFISPTNGSVYASPSWTNRGAASREDNILSYTHSTHTNEGNMLWGEGKQRRNSFPHAGKERHSSLYHIQVVSHNMDAEWVHYLLIGTEKNRSLDYVFFLVDILRGRSTGRAWHLNSNTAKAGRQQRHWRMQLPGDNMAIFKSH